MKITEKLLALTSATLLCGVAGYLWLVGREGGSTSAGAWVYAGGVLLTAAIGVVVLFFATYGWRRPAYLALTVSTAAVAGMFAFTVIVEPDVGQQAEQSRVAALEARARREAVESLQCADGAAVHMLQRSGRDWSVVLFHGNGEGRRAEQLAGFSVLDFARRCEIADSVERRASLEPVLRTCSNPRDVSVADLVERVRGKPCPFEETP